jgi:hypothetical protein
MIKAKPMKAQTLTSEKLVRPVRFELTAFCSGGKRSIQAELRAHLSHCTATLHLVVGPITVPPLKSDSPEIRQS